MLTPAPPIKGDPLYREKMEQYRKDLAEKRRNPDGWGIPGENDDDNDTEGESLADDELAE